MSKHIEYFLNYLLDTVTTSEIVFVENIDKNDQLFQLEHLKDWESTVSNKLEELNLNVNISMYNEIPDNGLHEISSATSTLVDDDEDDSDDNVDQESSKNTYVKRSKKPAYFYADYNRQCQRLLRLLYHCQQHYTHFIKIYYSTIKQCVRCNKQSIVSIALKQIATHIFEATQNNVESQNSIENLQLNTLLSTVPESHRSMLSVIEVFLTTSGPTMLTNNFLRNYIDILYTNTSRFLNVRQEFRDSARYFIDGDSLILSIAHHLNINLDVYDGNTLHIVFVIERILLKLLQQSTQSNYTLVFFDCHHDIYGTVNSLLSLIRSCFIAHLSKNISEHHTMKVAQFSSWLTDDYLEYVREERPMFLLYHDMSTFQREQNQLLSTDALEQLFSIYRLFGNYHQYALHCQLYLMNKLILTETAVTCFQMQFIGMCPKIVISKVMQTILVRSQAVSNYQKRNWNELETLCKNIAEHDIRLFLYLKTISILNEQQQQQQQQLAYGHIISPLLILHVALLIRLSLADRHLPSSIPLVTYNSAFSQFIVEFQRQLSSNVSSLLPSMSYAKIVDLFDGRLFKFTLDYISRSSSEISFDSKTNEIVQASLNFLNISICENLFQNCLKQLIQLDYISCPGLPIESSLTIAKRSKLIRISNPLIDTYLQPIISSNDELSFDFIQPNESQLLLSDVIHRETCKDIVDEIEQISKKSDIEQEPKNHRFRTTKLQRLFESHNLYGKSLTTRDVKDNQLDIILPTASTPLVEKNENDADQNQTTKASCANKTKQQHKGQKNKTTLTKGEMIIEDNKRRMDEKRVAEETERMAQVVAKLQRIPKGNYSDIVKVIDDCLPIFESSTNRLKLLNEKQDTLRKYLRTLKEKRNLSIEETSRLELLQVEFFATVCHITHLENVVDAFNKKKKLMEELVDDRSLDAEKWYRFQLETINSRLPRRKQGVEDSRMPDFIPDPWQVQFLDAIDQQQSVIIVAATASGKTYASYYAMEKVLKNAKDPRGICVYVAPTRVLITQAAGTVTSKYGTEFGILTKTYVMNLQQCRILITFPECLEMLLLSPYYQQLCQRIRYCIFDEIHCMSADIGTESWERSMLLINCPMIGLSATVNNGECLQQWITNVERQRSILFKTPQPREVRFISNLERLADLNKYLYSNRQLYPLHPIGLMNSEQLMSRGLPKDLSLSPCETLQLSDAIRKENIRPNAIPTLTEHFSPGWITERNQCNAYSRLVCQQFNRLIEKNETTTIDSISSSLNSMAKYRITYPELKPTVTLIGEFILTLKEKNLLPCIIFTDSRSLCEELAESVTQYFEQLEDNLRRTKYRYEIEQIEKRLESIEKAQKSTKPKKAAHNQRIGNKSNDNDYDDTQKPHELLQMEEEDQSQLRLSGYERELLYGTLEETTLANHRTSDKELVDKLIAKIESIIARHPELVRYIKRGVAYHHPQLNNKGRLAVEGLFRNRHVQVLFSTWTLTLGVHMPAKTVAFVKDSIELDALQYRQSSGRAGRRGFDVQGNIIFLDIPISKIRHLTVASIPKIQTNPTISVTYIMRLLHLYCNAKDKTDAMNRSLLSLQCPFYTQTSSTPHLIDVQYRYHCLYTLDFLYRLNLINKQGDLIGLARILTRLRQEEPINLLLGHLINTRLLHELNNDEHITHLLASLFTNVPLFMTRRETNVPLSISERILSNTKYSLNPLSTDICHRIEKYNSLVKQIYGSYIENVLRKIRSMNHDIEKALPFSNISFSQSSDYDNGTFEYNLQHHYSQQAQNPSISPFAGPSGLTHEQFMANYNPSIGSWDLAYDIDLSTRIVPYVDIYARDHTNVAYHLNSYALDYFRHGSEHRLITENDIDRNDTFHLLNKFLQVLWSMKDSFATMKDKEPSFFAELYKKLHHIENDFAVKFYREFE